MSEDASGCACALPTGCWGVQGWHFTRYTEELARRQLGVPVEEWDPERARPYLGQPVAYERCPAYWSVVARQT